MFCTKHIWLCWSCRQSLVIRSSHFVKWPPFWPKGWSGMSLYQTCFLRVCYNCVPNFMLVSSKAQNYQNIAQICRTTRTSAVVDIPAGRTSTPSFKNVLNASSWLDIVITVPLAILLFFNCLFVSGADWAARWAATSNVEVGQATKLPGTGL